jgi:hypothetical protein
MLFFAVAWACFFFTTQAMGCQGKRSGLTAYGGVVHLLMPGQSFLLLHRFLFPFLFLLMSF